MVRVFLTQRFSQGMISVPENFYRKRLLHRSLCFRFVVVPPKRLLFQYVY